jgi:hypothetical protein
LCCKTRLFLLRVRIQKPFLTYDQGDHIRAWKSRPTRFFAKINAKPLPWKRQHKIGSTYICNFQSTSQSNPFTHLQGDQIGRILAYWVTVCFGLFLKIEGQFSTAKVLQ